MNAPEAPRGVDVRHFRETRLNITISRVLVVGLLAAVVLLSVGVILTLARPGLAMPHTTSVSSIPRALARAEPGGFFELGLLMLLATPAARVVALLFAYVRRRQWMFASIALFVFAILVLGAYLGLTT
jgi:uncharacterized membrane protein